VSCGETILVGAEAEGQNSADNAEVGLAIEVDVVVEVDVQALDLVRQVVSEGVLDTTTHGPASNVVSER
jgi:hypothetical protein